MIAASRMVTDAKEQFEGGNSLAVNWNVLLRMAGRNLLDNLKPDTLKQVQSVYGGLSKYLYAYYMPSDVTVPTALYLNDGTRKWEYQPPQFFFADRSGATDKFSVKTHNGVKFLYVKHTVGDAMLVLDEMESITGVAGTATPTLNSRDFIEGSGSIQADFTDAGLYLQKTFDEVQDVTDYLSGILLLPFKIESGVDNLSALEVRLQTTASDYYRFATALDSTVSANFVNGWNLARFAAENKSSVGSPDAENIVSWRIIATAATGETVTLIFDRFALQDAAPFYIEGYSEKIFAPVDGGSSESVDYSTDSINVEEDVYGIMLYELLLLIKGASEEMKADFAAQLSRKYGNYFENHPQEQAALSYNIAPEMTRETEPTGSAYLDSDVWRQDTD